MTDDNPLWHEWVRANRGRGERNLPYETDFQTYLEQQIIDLREQVADLRTAIYGKPII